MADEKDSSWSFNDIIEAGKSLGKAAGEIYGSFKGSDTDSEETAYLKGQLAAINADKEAKTAANTIKIGDAEISTSSVLWVVGGTLGLLAVGLVLRNFLKG